MTAALWLFGGIAVALVLFWLLDRWHQRYAWRKAQQEATEYMEKHYGKRNRS